MAMPSTHEKCGVLAEAYFSAKFEHARSMEGIMLRRPHMEYDSCHRLLAVLAPYMLG